MLELNQVQSNILREYRFGDAPQFVQFLFLHFGNPDGARDLIKALEPLLTSCAALDGRAAKTGSVLNFGLAYPALELLGIGGNVRALDDSDHEATGAIEAFKCGMEVRARAILRDVDASDPDQWEPAYRGHQLHAVLCLSAHAELELASLRSELDTLVARFAWYGVRVVHEEQGQHHAGEHAGKEHFGFVDGIGQPEVLGAEQRGYPGDGTPSMRDWQPLAPGEFVLGQPDESGRIQFGSKLFKNGSFMVVRKLQQHVGRFREYVAAVGERRGVSPTLVAAKMVGRWPSGAPLVLAPLADDPELGRDRERNNDFRYARDREGERCPFGAHIRRNNPREDPSGPGVVQTRLHRIIRRAIPYGPWLPEGEPDDGVERGTLFVVINADISRQFEFVQQNWVNSVLSSTHLTLPADRDPFVGQQQPSGSKFVIPSAKRNQPPIIAWDLPSFVTTRGGGYFLLPSLDALYDIGHGVAWPQGDGCGSESEPATTECETPTEPPSEPALDPALDPMLPTGEPAATDSSAGTR